MTILRGLDASSVQGLLPFKALAERGYRFAILKAQEGNDGFDPFFERNMRGCLDAGIEVMAYGFAFPLHARRPDGVIVPGRDPLEQAKLFVDRVHRFPEMIGRPLCLDYEWPEPGEWSKWGVDAASIAAWCKANAAEVERLSDRTPAIYTYPWWWSCVSAADVAWAAEYPLWLAAYVPSEPKDGASPKVPAPWKTWAMWQWDGNGGAKLPNGVDADFCLFNGDESALQTFVHGAGPLTEREPPMDDRVVQIADFAIVHPAVPMPPVTPSSDDD